MATTHRGCERRLNSIGVILSGIGSDGTLGSRPINCNRDDRIDGSVVTFAGITVAGKLETKLRGQHVGSEKQVAEESMESARAIQRAVGET